MVHATRGLLGDAVEIVRPLGHQFVVVGGWSPLLLNSQPIPHPGTHDVDLLFLDGFKPYYLKNVIQTLFKHGYLPSAKHPFQLLKTLNVGGQPLLFNLDLLHPMETEIKPELFVDHLNLPVPVGPLSDERLKSKSIVLQVAHDLFLDTEAVPVDCTLPDGREREVVVPLMSEVGTVVTKASSVTNEKRSRDAFDVFLAMSQGPRSATIDGLRAFIKRRGGDVAWTKNLVTAVQTRKFALNTMRHLGEVGAADVISAKGITELAATFLRESGIPCAISSVPTEEKPL